VWEVREEDGDTLMWCMLPWLRGYMYAFTTRFDPNKGHRVIRVSVGARNILKWQGYHEILTAFDPKRGRCAVLGNNRSLKYLGMAGPY
jgi:hypothetical protein